MIKDLNLMEGQEDLRIVEHLDMHKPASLNISTCTNFLRVYNK